MRELEAVWPAVRDDPEVRGPVALALVDVAMSRAYAEALAKREQKLKAEAERYAANPTINVHIGDVFNNVNIQLPSEVGKKRISAATAASIIAIFLAFPAFVNETKDLIQPAPSMTPTATPTAIPETPTPTATSTPEPTPDEPEGQIT